MVEHRSVESDSIPHGDSEFFLCLTLLKRQKKASFSNLLQFSRQHIPTNSAAPFSDYKPTHYPQFLQSLNKWITGKLPTYFSGDTECLDHNMSLISCKLVHTFFFPSRPYYLKAEAKYIRADTLHSPLAPSEIPGIELHTIDVFLFNFLITFEYFYV